MRARWSSTLWRRQKQHRGVGKDGGRVRSLHDCVPLRWHSLDVGASIGLKVVHRRINRAFVVYFVQRRGVRSMRTPGYGHFGGWGPLLQVVFCSRHAKNLPGHTTAVSMLCGNERNMLSSNVHYSISSKWCVC